MSIEATLFGNWYTAPTFARLALNSVNMAYDTLVTTLCTQTSKMTMLADVGSRTFLALVSDYTMLAKG